MAALSGSEYQLNSSAGSSSASCSASSSADLLFSASGSEPCDAPSPQSASHSTMSARPHFTRTVSDAGASVRASTGRLKCGGTIARLLHASSRTR